MWMREWKKMKGTNMMCYGGKGGGMVYCLGFIGALVYYLTHTATL